MPETLIDSIVDNENDNPCNRQEKLQASIQLRVRKKLLLNNIRKTSIQPWQIMNP